MLVRVLKEIYINCTSMMRTPEPTQFEIHRNHLGFGSVMVC